MTLGILVLGLAVLGIRAWFQRRSSSGAKREESLSDGEHALSPEARQRLDTWLAAMEAGELCTPDDVHDAQAWNRYWRKQIDVSAIEQGFNDMMSSDRRLVAFLRERGVTTILCAGAGLSSEPLAFALHGFEVTALDISDIPRGVIAGQIVNGTHAISRIPGVTVKEEGATVAIPSGTFIDQQLCPPIHRSDDPPRGGGSVSYVTGDLDDATICPGPFDAVIERRTIQLFPDTEQHSALDRLAARLGPRAYLLSHQHRGNWKPGQPLRHYASDWLKAGDFVAEDASNASATARVARLYLTTG